MHLRRTNRYSFRDMKTQTTTELASRWAGQGALLVRLVASFSYGRLTEWRSIVDAAGVPIRSLESGPDASNLEVNVSALPEKVTPGSLYLTLQTHPHKESPAHWVFQWHLAPDASPPAGIRRQSSAVGGYTRLLEKVSRGFPEGSSVEANLTAAFVLNKKLWGTSSLIRTVGVPGSKKRVRNKRRSLELAGRSDSWQITPPSGAVERLKLTWSAGEGSSIILTAEVSAKKALNPREPWLPALAESLWQDVEPLLAVKSKAK